MEELSIEKKAKAYDEALERAKKLQKTCDSQAVIGWCEYIFPELKEGEEKIRNWLIGYFRQYKEDGMEKYANGLKVDSILAWLEKQDEQKQEINNFDVLPGLYKCVHRMFDGTPDGRLLFEVGNVYKCLSKHDRAEFEVSYGHSVYLEDPVVCKHFIPFEKQDEQKPADEIGNYDHGKVLESLMSAEMKTPEESLGIDSDTYNKIVDECIYGEQKPVDKVEPKFKVGDWLVHNERKHIVKIINHTPFDCKVVNILGYHHTITNAAIENNYHLWTIEDAQNGDVLINDFHLIFIFKEIKNNMYTSHCSIIDRGNDVIVNSVAEREVGDVNLVKCQPATKEQYDLLFSKMKEAGYEWDAENKELKKIEQKPVVIIPKFRIGDNIKTTNEEPLTITKIDGKGYWSEDLLVCGFDDAAKWELVEQKPADKVEPKFKVDDWVVYYRNDSSREVLQVYDIRDGRYYFTDNVHFSWSVKECDEKSHLWAIQDAKDGDVLAEDTCTFIIKKLNHDLTAKIYCCLHDDGDFELNSNLGFDDTCTYPATEEQRDLLFAKMKEAGYEWDTEKKELKLLITNGGDFFESENCEQKPAWSEEDKEFINDLIGIFDGQQYQAHSDEEIVKWLKSIRLPYNKEWDENDEEMLKSIIATCELACEDRDSSPAKHLLEMQTNWLKSLKARYIWKPSDEQKPAWSEEDEVKINRIVACLENLNVADNDILLKDVDWLKSLKQRIGG